MKRFLLALPLLFLTNCIVSLFPGGGVRQEWEEKRIEGKGPDKVLILPIEGVISDDTRESFFGPSSESMVSSVKEQLRRAETDSSIKAVILKINSPGGTVTASDIIYNEIQSFKNRTKIPVMALFYDTAASGGYYIAMASDHIAAHPTTVTGSIGVILQGVNFKEGLDKIGVKEQFITSGPNKSIGSPFKEMSAEQKLILQSIVDDLYSRFFLIVSKGRPNIPNPKLEKLADGRIFTAKQAKEAGLVDSVGYFEDALRQLKTLPHYKPSAPDKSVLIITFKRGKGKVENVYQANQENPHLIPSLMDRLVFGNKEMKFLYLWTY